MGDYVTGLFREALGRLEEGYRAGGMRDSAETVRSLADDESKSYSGAHSVLDRVARTGERFDPFAYPTLAMSAVDGAIRRGDLTADSDQADIRRLLGEEGTSGRGIEDARRDRHAPGRHHRAVHAEPGLGKPTPADLGKLARESAARAAAGPTADMAGRRL